MFWWVSCTSARHAGSFDPRLDLSSTPGLRPIGLSPGSWQTSLGLGSMSRYSAQILICIIKTPHLTWRSDEIMGVWTLNDERDLKIGRRDCGTRNARQGGMPHWSHHSIHVIITFLQEEMTEKDILKHLPGQFETTQIMSIVRLLSEKATTSLGDYEIQYLSHQEQVDALGRWDWKTLCNGCGLFYLKKNHSGYGLCQWEKALLCNAFSHWPSPYQEWCCSDALVSLLLHI